MPIVSLAILLSPSHSNEDTCTTIIKYGMAHCPASNACPLWLPFPPDVLSDTEQCQTYVTGVLTPRSTLWVAPSPSLLATWTIFNTPEPCSISGAPVWHLVKHGTPFHSDLRRVWTESDCVCRGVAGCGHCPSAGLLRYPFRMRHLIICPSLSPLLYGLLYNLRED